MMLDGVAYVRFKSKLPRSWQFVELKADKFEFASGLWTGKKPPYTTACVLRNTNFNNDGTLDYFDVAELEVEERHLKKSELRYGDIIIEKSGGGPKQPVGRVVLFNVNSSGYSFSNFTCRLRVADTSSFEPKFVLYYLMALYDAGIMEGIQNRTTGIRNLDLTSFKQIGIPHISLSEQRSIAAALTKLQEAIADKQEIVDRTRELKKALMAKLLTGGLRGEPTRDTEIGPIPESWEVRQIGTFAKFQGGFAFKSTDYLSEGVPLFKISNVSFGKTCWEEISFLPEQFLDTYRDFELKPGDLVMAMTRPIVEGGIKVTRISKSDCPCLLNQRVGRFVMKNTVDSEYLSQILFNKHFIKSIVDGAGGSQQPNISARQIEQIQVPFPTYEEQKEIGHILQSIDTKINTSESKLLSLQDLFKTMLNELMTGNIRTTPLMEA